MKKTYQKLLVAVAMAAACSIAPAQSISVLVPSAPGGGFDNMSRALVASLNENGVSATLEQTGTCKGAMNWIKNNPEKPVLFPMMVEEEVYRKKNPSADDACNVGLTQNRVIATTMMATFNVCSMKPQTASTQTVKEFLSGKHKLGVTYFAATNAMVADSLLKSLGIESKVVRLQGNAKLVQALVSGDVDFVLNTSSGPVVQAGGHCFLTTADKSTAEKLNMISLQTLSPNNSWIGAGQLYIVMGDNINKNKITPLVKQAVKENENFKRLFIGGVNSLVDLSGNQQMQEIEKHIQRF
jgi:hypothetical protein